MNLEPIKKACTKCFIEKSLDDFHKRPEGKYKRKSECITCARKKWNLWRKSVQGQQTCKTWEINKREQDPSYFSKKKLQRHHDKRNTILNAYGCFCKCCGESNKIFLAIDHVNNDGNVDRKKRGSQAKIMNYIIDAGFPADYQILCFNCNWAKAHGGCPHAKVI